MLCVGASTHVTIATCEVGLHQLRQRMHEPPEQTGEWLQSVVQGYFNYHAVPGNTDSLGNISPTGDSAPAVGSSPSRPKAPAQLGPKAFGLDMLCGYALSSFHGEEDEHVFQSICAVHSASILTKK